MINATAAAVTDATLSQLSSLKAGCHAAWPNSHWIEANQAVAETGRIKSGLAVVAYENTPVGLLAREDVVPSALLTLPLSVRAINRLELTPLSEEQAHPYLEAALKSLAAHAARCARLPALERTEEFLICLAGKISSKGNAVSRVDIPLTQAIMASLLSMSVVHLNRVLMKLRSKGLIEMRPGHVIVKGGNA